MERKYEKTLRDGTQLSVDPDRPYSDFLVVRGAHYETRFSMTAAVELNVLLSAYFDDPTPTDALAGLLPPGGCPCGCTDEEAAA